MNKKAILVGLACFCAHVVFAKMSVSSGTVTPGEWNLNFTQAKTLAEQKHMPLVIFWANPGCGWCGKLETACQTKAFLAWQEKRQLLMVFCRGTSGDNGVCKQFVKNKTGLFPYVGIYWPKKSETVKELFSGRQSFMPVSTESSLGECFMASVDMYTKEWDPTLANVSAADVSKKYDGKGVSIDVEGADSIEGATVRYRVVESGDETYSDFNPSFTNAGDYVVSYLVTAPDYAAVTGTAKVTIAKRSVTLTSGTSSWTYDGNAHSDLSVKVSGDGFAEGEGYATTNLTSIVNIGVVTNEFSCWPESGTCAENYEITQVYGTLKVTEDQVEEEDNPITGDDEDPIVEPEPEPEEPAINTWASQAYSATLPLYQIVAASTNTVAVTNMVGCLDFSMTKKGKVTGKARIGGYTMQTVVFSGKWGEQDSSGIIQVVCARSAAIMTARATAGGVLTVDVTGLRDYDSLTSGKIVFHKPADLKNWVGSYTIAFPWTEIDDADPTMDTVGPSHGMLKIAVTSSKSTGACSLTYPDAKHSSISVKLAYDGKYVLAPIMAAGSAHRIAACARISTIQQEPSCRCVIAANNSVGHYWHFKANYPSDYPCAVMGSYITPKSTVSGMFGSQRSVNYCLEYLGDLSDYGFAKSFSFTKQTYYPAYGLFKGTVSLRFEKRSTTSKYQGVVLPGWFDSPTTGIGCSWYKDSIGGKTIWRGCPVTLNLDDSSATGE